MINRSRESVRRSYSSMNISDSVISVSRRISSSDKRSC
jgi:hypothetical protein